MRIILSLLIMLSCSLFTGSVVSAPQDTLLYTRDLTPDELPKSIVNPSAWLSECYTQLNDLYLYQTERELDTAVLFKKFREHLVIVTILKKNFYGKAASLNIRTVYNMKMRLGTILAGVGQWKHRIHKENELLVDKTREIIRIRSEIDEFRVKSDTVFRATYAKAVNQLSERQHQAEAVILEDLKKSTDTENKIIDISVQIRLFYTDVSSLLREKEASLLSTELPPLWKSPPGVYPSSVLQVLTASFNQTLESLKYYSEMSIWKIVIFRLLILLLCLVPIRIFNNELRKQKIMTETGLVFLAKFPKTASIVMGMALAPVIFDHPPHAFMEFILIGLTFTVTSLTLKNYPKINKPLLILLITAFLVLYLINFFVTPTFTGRLIYSTSILLLIPLYRVYRDMHQWNLEYEKTVRALVIFLAIHLVTGWFFVIFGTYTLGRSVILASYSLLIISMILRIAIYTLLDYIEIIAYFFNKQAKSFKINILFIHRNTKPLLVFLAAIFLVISYLFNMNMYDLVVQRISDLLLAPRKIGDAHYTLMSILLFFLSIYLAFTVANLIRYFFELQHDESIKKRSKLGSYLLLFRLLILIGGFTIGVLASGLALTNFTILLGAMGVGIGFGLQNIVANLVSGLIIAFERPFVIGDVLDFENETCKVKEINLRATMVSNANGADILIPNSQLLSENVKNWTISNKQRFVEMKVMTSHEPNPTQVIEIIRQCLEKQNDITADRSMVLFSDIGDTGFTFTIKILVNEIGTGVRIKSQLLQDIREAFVHHDIPFPKKMREWE